MRRLLCSVWLATVEAHLREEGRPWRVEHAEFLLGEARKKLNQTKHELAAAKEKEKEQQVGYFTFKRKSDEIRKELKAATDRRDRYKYNWDQAQALVAKETAAYEADYRATSQAWANRVFAAAQEIAEQREDNAHKCHPHCPNNGTHANASDLAGDAPADNVPGGNATAAGDLLNSTAGNAMALRTPALEELAAIDQELAALRASDRPLSFLQTGAEAASRVDRLRDSLAGLTDLCARTAASAGDLCNEWGEKVRSGFVKCDVQWSDVCAESFPAGARPHGAHGEIVLDANPKLVDACPRAVCEVPACEGHDACATEEPP